MTARGTSPFPSPAALAAWLPEQRWFASKGQAIAAVTIDDTVVLPGVVLAVAAVRLADGTADRYLLTLGEGTAPREALDDPGAGHAILDVVARGARVAGPRGALAGRPGRTFPSASGRPAPARRLGGEQSNTSVAFGDALVMKIFRRLRAGANPEEEIGRFLTERTRFAHVPRLAGTLQYEAADGTTATVAVVQELITGARDGWQWALDELRGADRGAAGVPAAALRRLGQRTGELHGALASDTRDPAFAPEPIGEADVRRWAVAVAVQLEAARRALGGALPAAPPDVTPILARALRGVAKIRHHGDFHLGQTLWVAARADFVIIDFEGEPLRPLAERRAKHAALRDVAGMRRSLGYAAAVGAAASPAWEREAVRAFTEGYRAATTGAAFVPPAAADFERATAVFEVEKAAYEIVYEAGNRPEWVAVPARGLVSAVDRLAATASAGEA